MTGLNHGWGADERPNHADFIHGAVDIDDFDDEPRQRKQSRKRRRSGECKKSKTRENCNFTVAVIIRSWYSSWDERWHYQRVITCERCGKHGRWDSFSTIMQI